VLIASSEVELQELINRVKRVASDKWMRVNVKKTKVMKVSDDATPLSVTIGGKVEEVYTFKYLGAIFNSNAVCADEIKAWLLQGRQRMGQLTRLWRSRTLTNKLNARLIQELVWPLSHTAQGVNVETRTKRERAREKVYFHDTTIQL